MTLALKVHLQCYTYSKIDTIPNVVFETVLRWLIWRPSQVPLRLSQVSPYKEEPRLGHSLLSKTPPKITIPCRITLREEKWRMVKATRLNKMNMKSNWIVSLDQRCTDKSSIEPLMGRTSLRDQTTYVSSSRNFVNQAY